MKKYLMIGFAAVAFAACSNHDFETYTPEQVVKAEYDAKFIAEFGKPGPQQDWGFGATTRAFTRGINPNGNMWGSTYKVPTQLTQEQKELVRKFFQQNKRKYYEDPELTNFFMQQVYKGGTTTKTKGDPTDPNCQTDEEYASANGGWVIGSNHMDHLAACNADGSIKDHIYNFNFGTCSTNNDILNSVGVTYTNPNGNYHSDEIQLAESSTTKKFGYFNSDGSLGHTEYTSLVSWRTIAQWAMENNIENITSIEQSCLNDDWNRSFMGFDFEQVVGEDVYQGNALYSDMPGFDRYIWDGENVIDVVDHYDENNNWAPVFKEGYETLKYDGKIVRCLKNETNQYCGDRKWKDGGDLYEEVTDEHSNAIIIYKDGKKCLNMPFINSMLEAEYLPVATKNFREWVKVEGGADGYYSDWIVTLTKAEEVDNTTYAGRIMAEDLTPNSSSDWDFNDVVFDFAFEGNDAVIKLRAAGGTLPLTIGGSPKADNPNEPILDAEGNVAGGQEVHGLFGLNNTSTMINTGAGVTKEAVKVRLTDKTYSKASDIMICVKKKVDGVEKWIVINAFQGEPAAKFVTETTVDWVDEFANIKGAYPQFETYVQSGSGKFAPSEKVGVYFDRITRNETSTPAQ